MPESMPTNAPGEKSIIELNDFSVLLETIKRPEGRPAKYSDVTDLQQVELLGFYGMTNERLSQFYRVALTVIYKWKRDYPEFVHALQTGKDRADNTVEKTLFERATGAKAKEIKLFVINGEVVEKEITKHYPPETAAAKMWLMNRRPDIWRDLKAVEFTGKSGGPIEYKVEDSKAVELLRTLAEHLAGEDTRQLPDPGLPGMQDESIFEDTVTPEDLEDI